MARLEEVIAAERVGDAEVLRVLQQPGTAPWQTCRRPIAQWTLDAQTGRLVCGWTLAD